MKLRNWLYTKNVFSSTSFETPVIVVGNLSVGGTGKTPMIEYLLEILLPQYEVATLSRGYGRKTKGFIELQGGETAKTVGDEPLQFKTKYPEAIVVVDENRQRGITRIISKYDPDVVLLDDAYQHRKVKARCYILLTSYDNIYSEDFMLPTGNLREPKSGASRADVIIITKCPETLSLPEQEGIRKKLKIRSHQQLFFSYINYSNHLLNGEGQKVKIDSLKDKKVNLVTGIAKPQPLIQYLKMKKVDFNHFQFPDHHNFSEKDLKSFSGAHTIVTTEKDFMRLKSLVSQFNFYYLPIKTQFLNRQQEFQHIIKNFINEK